MNITTYGYENPSSGDLSKGTNGWMAQVNFDISRLDGHTHNGIDSALLSINSIAPLTLAVASGSWASNSGTPGSGGSGTPAGGFFQLLTVPAGILEINNYIIKFYVSSGNLTSEPVYLLYKRVTATTFNLYSNDSTLNLVCVFR